jgi:hypothetical protein
MVKIQWYAETSNGAWSWRANFELEKKKKKQFILVRTQPG